MLLLVTIHLILNRPIDISSEWTKYSKILPGKTVISVLKNRRMQKDSPLALLASAEEKR
jgi:hypothetical protein